MKTTKLSNAIIAASLTGALLFAGTATASDSSTLAVSATVQGVCHFTATGFNMTFDSINPHDSGAKTKASTISYKCTNGTPSSAITFDGGATGTSVNLSDGSSNLPVTLSWTTPATNGSGFGTGSSAITFDVTGSIANADYANKAAGTYTKNVTIAIAP